MRKPLWKRVAKWFSSLTVSSEKPITAEKQKQKELKIRAETLGLAAQRGARIDALEAFKVYDPMPGVVPKDVVSMAQDDSSTIQAVAWAMGQNFHEGIGFLGYPYLAELAQRPEYRRISEIIAKEMTRKWIRLVSIGDDDNSAKIEQLKAALKRYKVQAIFRRAAELDGFFGRSHIFIDLKRQDDKELKFSIGNGVSPLSKIKIGKGSLKALRIVEPVWAYPNAYNSQNPLADDYFRPTSWFVQGKLIHASRLLTFIGREVSDLLKPAYSFGGLSLSQMAKPYVDNWLRTRQSVSDLLHSFSVFVLKTNMDSVLAGESGTGLFDRMDLFNQTRDNRGLMAIDMTAEELENVSAPLGTLDALQAQSQEHMAAVSGIPLVKLLGITPSGLNASSDGEMRSFYDWIEAQQESSLFENLSKVLNVIQLSEFGEIDPRISFKFLPLWTLDAAALSTKRKTDMDTDIAAIDAGVIDPQESRKRVADDEDSPYESLEIDKVITPPQEPDPMAPGSNPAAGAGGETGYEDQVNPPDTATPPDPAKLQGSNPLSPLVH